jgi:hypothetical protein
MQIIRQSVGPAGVAAADERDVFYGVLVRQGVDRMVLYTRAACDRGAGVDRRQPPLRLALRRGYRQPYWLWCGCGRWD